VVCFVAVGLGCLGCFCLGFVDVGLVVFVLLGGPGGIAEKKGKGEGRRWLGLFLGGRGGVRGVGCCRGECVRARDVARAWRL